MAIEQNAQELSRIVSSLELDVEWLADGFGGYRGTPGIPWWPAEGPLWWREGGYLLFSDIGQNRRMKWASGEGVSLFMEPSNEANGLTRDPQGRLVACEHATRRVTRLEADGTVTVVADRYDGKRLNRPNDVVVKSDGSIYFTDPLLIASHKELEFRGVFRVSPDLSDIAPMVTDCTIPNGLCFSPGESILYVNDSVERHIRAFDVQDDGTLTNDRVFCVLKGERAGVPDGMKVDLEGNVYCTGPGGIWIIDPSGKHLGTILTGEGNNVTNVGWGDEDWKTMYLTTFDKLGRVRLKIPGVPVPR